LANNQSPSPQSTFVTHPFTVICNGALLVIAHGIQVIDLAKSQEPGVSLRRTIPIVAPHTHLRICGKMSIHHSDMEKKFASIVNIRFPLALCIFTNFLCVIDELARLRCKTDSLYLMSAQQQPKPIGDMQTHVLTYQSER
jgi:hypothetical protein